MESNPTKINDTLDLIREITNDVDRFVNNGKNREVSLRKRHRVTMLEGDKKIQSLKQEKKELKLKLKQSERFEEREARQLEALRNDLQKLKIEETRLPSSISETEEAIDEQLRKIASQQSDLNSTASSVSIRTTELQHAIEWYKTYLGLKFNSLEGNRIHFSFTMIDPREEEREFYFILKVLPKDQFLVEECVPTVNYTTALESFNQTQKISPFIRSMRKLFQAHCFSN